MMAAELCYNVHSAMLGKIILIEHAVLINEIN